LDVLLRDGDGSSKDGARELLDGSGDGEGREGIGDLLDGGAREFTSFRDTSSGVGVVGGRRGRVKVVVFGRVGGRDVLVIVVVVRLVSGGGRARGGSTGSGVPTSMEGKHQRYEEKRWSAWKEARKREEVDGSGRGKGTNRTAVDCRPRPPFS